MIKRNDYQRRSNNHGGFSPHGQRPQGEQVVHKDGMPRDNSQQKNHFRDNRDNNRENIRENRDNRDNRDTRENRDNRDNRDIRDNNARQGFAAQNPAPRRVKSEETLDDIIVDIARIEKEIELEIKEIKSLRLGM